MTLKGTELGYKILERHFKKNSTTLLKITRHFLKKHTDGVKDFITQLQLLKRYYEKA